MRVIQKWFRLSQSSDIFEEFLNLFIKHLILQISAAIIIQ